MNYSYMAQARDHTSAKDAQHLASWEVNPPMCQRGGITPRDKRNCLTPLSPLSVSKVYERTQQWQKVKTKKSIIII